MVRWSASDERQISASAALTPILMYIVHSGCRSLASLNSLLLENRLILIDSLISVKTSFTPQNLSVLKKQKRPTITVDLLIA